MSSAVIRTTPLHRLSPLCAAMLLFTAAPFAGAQAQPQAQGAAAACYAAPAASAEPGADSRNLCLRDIVDGHAAVRLPAADIPIDDAARMAKGERWGFLDAQGGLAIAPQFLAVDDFRHGLAAVRTEQGWGYVDAQGDWAIGPSYAYAGPFAESGLALVRTPEGWQVIDRQGAVVLALDAGVAQATLEGAAPSRLALRYARRHLAPQGEEVAVPADVTLVEALGSEGLLVARRGDTWGLLDGSGQWRVEPRYAAIDPWRGPGMAGAATAREASGALRVLRANGEVSSEAYEQARPLAGRYVTLVAGDGATHLFRSSGEAVLSLAQAPGQSLREAGAFLFWQPADGQTLVLAPQATEPTALPRDQVVRSANGEVLLLAQGPDGPVRGLVLPSGRRIETGDALASVARVERQGERIWLADAQGRWLDILDADGRSLLAASARQALREGSWQRLDGDAAGMPLALARTHCGCAAGGAGLIDADGRLVADAAWNGLLPDDPARRDGAPRFRVTTAQGMGVLDERGGVVLAPRLGHIGAFRGDYAVAYADGAMFAVDRQGARHALPDVFVAEPIGGTWFRFLDSALADANWGIYDVASESIVQTPPLAAIGERQGEYTQAAVRTDGGLRWGVLGPDGQWRLQPEFAEFERLASGDWKAVAPAAQGRARIGIVAPDGRWLVEPVEGLEIVADATGSWAAAAGSRSWMRRPDGDVLASAPGERYVRQDRWIVVERAPQVGYLEPDGAWALAPFDADGASAFTPQRRTALVWRGERAWLVDEAGKEIARLPDGPGWRWPAQAEGPYRVRRGEDGKRSTQYADANGKITHTLDGVGGPRINGMIVLSPAQGRVTRLDVNAKESVNWFLDSLRPGAGGPAAAGVRGRYGYVDAQGRYVLAPVYAAAQAFVGERAVVSTHDQSLLIDAAGRPLARVERQCGIHVLYGADATRVWPEQMPVRCPPA
ncbi:WG repeat-containing protein [Verticiella sediminum]|uniref:WG repeat-containing protein n=1 Tax=Verticiella sediminum TaxID=1247510 RepID=A0A556AZI0_9BURK|nr:WG repeat-containing protein [Verticiella sediminum]TSH98326.1 WG repeat-containing protein [Verticiella sediminum]